MILNETVAAIADAIREKTGKSELIKPVDFASEIKGISGGGESGGTRLYYTKSSAFTANDLQGAASAKIKGTGVLSVGTMIGMIVDLETTLSNITAIMVSPTKMKIGETVIELNEEILREMYKDGFTEITEAQFYTLE